MVEKIISERVDFSNRTRIKLNFNVAVNFNRKSSAFGAPYSNQINVIFLSALFIFLAYDFTCSQFQVSSNSDPYQIIKFSIKMYSYAATAIEAIVARQFRNHDRNLQRTIYTYINASCIIFERFLPRKTHATVHELFVSHIGHKHGAAVRAGSAKSPDASVRRGATRNTNANACTCWHFTRPKCFSLSRCFVFSLRGSLHLKVTKGWSSGG